MNYTWNAIVRQVAYVDFVKVKSFSTEPLQVLYLAKHATEKRRLGALGYKVLSKKRIFEQDVKCVKGRRKFPNEKYCTLYVHLPRFHGR
jgi:hypothetical protein